jgi:hypothetical protein
MLQNLVIDILCYSETLGVAEALVVVPVANHIFSSCNCYTSGVILEMPKITLSNFTSLQAVAFKERNLFKDLS